MSGAKVGEFNSIPVISCSGIFKSVDIDIDDDDDDDDDDTDYSGNSGTTRTGNQSTQTVKGSGVLAWIFSALLSNW